MADFPPNLDDGELWLPSDIFHNEAPSNRKLLHHQPSMDDIAQRFAALTLLRQQRNFSKLQRFRPPVRSGTENPFPQRSFSFGNDLGCCSHLCGCKMVPNYGGSELFSDLQLPKPVQPRVDPFLETRFSVLKTQQNRLLPCQGSGFGVGGFVKVSGGTGVFHPRVLDTRSSNPNSSAFVQRKQGLRHVSEFQASSQRNSMTRVGLKSEFFYQLQPQMGLPQDWSY